MPGCTLAEEAFRESAAYWSEKAREYEKDAMRYRWLRDIGDGTFMSLKDHGIVPVDTIDDYIDAAIKMHAAMNGEITWD